MRCHDVSLYHYLQGEEGVAKVINLLKDEFDSAMALSGKVILVILVYLMIFVYTIVLLLVEELASIKHFRYASYAYINDIVLITFIFTCWYQRVLVRYLKNS